MERSVSDVLEMLHLTLDHRTNKDEMLRAYAVYSETYDADHASLLNYCLPAKSAEVLMENIAPKTDGKLLEIGCGTGLLGENLRKLGFEGTIHGIDASPEMLSVAKNKKMVYDKVFTQFIIPGTPIKGAPSMLYDIIICVGTFTKNHLHPKALKDFLPLIVKGGLIMATITDTSYNQEVTKQMKEVLEQLKESKEIDEVKVIKVKSFEIEHDKIPHGFKEEDFSDSSTANVFSLRKF